MTDNSIPENYSRIYDAESISARIDLLASEIDLWAKEVAQAGRGQVLAVCVLNGAIFYYSDLLRAIPSSVETAFCRAWSYSTEDNAQSGVKLSVDQLEAAGRSILLIDDICDTGATLAQLETVLKNLGALEVRSAVLIRRDIPKPAYTPQWSAFEFQGADWFVGYGMDDKGHHRNLPEVYSLKKQA